MPPQRSASNRPLLVGLIVLAVVSTLLVAAQGVATNLVSALVDDEWVNEHRHLVIWGFGLLAAASLLLAIVQAWLGYRASQPAASDSQSLSDHSDPHAEVTGQGGTAIGAIYGTVNLGAPAVPPLPAPKPVPSRSNLPPRNPGFTGRGQLLDQLREKLATGPAAVVAAHGLGGVGKTQLALEYAYQHRDLGDYDLVWWVPAETPLAVAAGLTLLAPVLGVAVEADQEATVAAVLAALSHRERWLLVFDNAEDPAQLRRYLPTGQGHVLLTSRNPAWAGVARPLDIDVLPLDEAVELLSASSIDADQAAAAKLAETLGRLPLALAQAAAYIQQTPGLGLASYLDRYQHAHAELLARGQPVDYPATVATTWQLNFDQLARTNPAAVELLRLCAFLAPETPIPLDLLTTAPDTLPAALAGAARDPVVLDDAAAALYRFSLVSPAEGGVRVHRLVQTVARTQLSGQQTSEWTTYAIILLWFAFPDTVEDPHGWPRAAQLLPHALVAADHAARWPSTQEGTGQLLNQAGIYLFSRAELPAARQTLERALRALEAAHGPDHPQVAITLGNLGIVLRDLGELAAARPIVEHALRIREAVHGPDHPQVASALTNLGSVLERLGELAAARRILERALRIEEAVRAPDHPQVAITLGSLGLVLRRLGELAAAREAQQRALRIFEAAHGPDHPQVAITLGNLGLVLQDLGELAAAREAQQRAVRIFEAAYGPEHPRTRGARQQLDRFPGR